MGRHTAGRQLVKGWAHLPKRSSNGTLAGWARAVPAGPLRNGQGARRPGRFYAGYVREGGRIAPVPHSLVRGVRGCGAAALRLERSPQRSRGKLSTSVWVGVRFVARIYVYLKRPGLPAYRQTGLEAAALN